MAVRLVALVVLAVVLGGCGSSGDAGSGSAGDALAYLPADAATVLLFSTDVDGEQWEQFDQHILRRLLVEEGSDRELSLDEYAEKTFREIGLDWQDDVRPLLGNDIAIGISGDPLSFFAGDGEASLVAALDTRGGDVEEVLEKADLRPQGEVSGATLFRYGDQDEPGVAVEDSVLLVADDEQVLREALARRDSGDGLDEDTVQEELADLPSDSFLRGFGTLDGLAEQEQLRRFASVGFFQVLETWAAAVRFEQDELNAEVAVRLDEEQVEEEDLPVVSGEDSPEIVPRGTEISGGNRNQSQTTVFLLRAVQAAYPNSRFVRAVDALDEDLGISFEEEILRQFNGPSASYVSPDGRTFAARSEVRDPEALRALLPRIAPHLPALVEGLQGLQSEGMALLFLFAPDAPAAAPMQGVKVDPPTSPDGLYRISGLTGDGPAELHLGLIGDLFVVASDEQRAREIASADTKPAEGAQGAGVLRADLAKISRDLGDFLFLFPLEGKELVASLEASTNELRARVRIELE
jgi:Protein of unknown function (DUF3352)